MKRKILLTTCLLGGLSLSYADSAPGEVYIAPQAKSSVVVKQLGNAKTFSFSANEFNAIKSTETKVKSLPVIGEVFESANILVPSSELAWVTDNGIASAEVIIELTDIEAFRASLETKLLSKATAVYVFEPNNREATWTQVNLANSEELQWLPTFSGSSLGMYIEADEKNTSDISVYVPKVLKYNDADLESRLKNVNQLGDSGSCEVDVACNNSGFTDPQDAVAKYIFVSGGSGYLCTGSLISDLDSSSQIPYFITAGHCVSTASEAASMELYWNFQMASCSSSSLDSAYTSTSGGGTLQASNAISSNSDIGVVLDYSLMKLNSTPPSGVYLSGWSSSAQSSGINITGIHHPAGDVKKISKGQNLGNSGNGHYVVQWSDGVTEGGSSGSGIWNDSQELIGVLSGGSASCSYQSGTDVYTSFDSFYPYISQYIAVAGGGDSDDGDTDSGTTTLDKRFSGAWYNRDRAGEGWLVEMLINNRINVYWFTYDDEGDPLYIFGSGTYDPTSTSVTVTAYTTDGPIFGDSYDKADLVRHDWGTMTFSFADCNNATVSYSSPLSGYGSGTRTATRLSIIEGTTCSL